MPNELAVTAEAADLLSVMGDGFDVVVLKAAEQVVAKRLKAAEQVAKNIQAAEQLIADQLDGPREVTVFDIREALGNICRSLEEALGQSDLPDDTKKSVESFIAFLRQLGANC